jgi:hypothetical protein
MGAANGAVEDLEQAAASEAADPAWLVPHAHLLLGLLALEDGDHGRAKEHLRRAGQRDRGAWFPEFLGRLERAEVGAARAAAHAAGRELLRVLYRQGPDGVEPRIRERLPAESAAPIRHFLLAELARLEGDAEAAESELRASIAYRGPDLHLVRARAMLLWARLCERQGRARLAAGIYRELSMAPGADPFEGMALRARAELVLSRAALDERASAGS